MIKENLKNKKERKQRPRSEIKKVRPSSRSVCQNSKIQKEEHNLFLKYNQGKVNFYLGLFGEIFQKGEKSVRIKN